MTTTGIVTMIVVVALFAAFSVTLAWAEMLTRRHTMARVSADPPRQRKRRPF